MLIGLDLDNTIIDYDSGFARVGRRLGLLPADFAGGKRDVRDHLRRRPEGDLLWQRLQAELYGPGIGEAVPSAGVIQFIELCREAGYDLAIVSHKTEFAAADPAGTNLRTSALGWLGAQGIAGERGIAAESIYFESTRHDKLARIGRLGCRYFVDDLEEVLLDPEFPPATAGLHFHKQAQPGAPDPRLIACRSWAEVARHILIDQARRPG
jgi:hypothetical protein